jgi:hypothetical protein
MSVPIHFAVLGKGYAYAIVTVFRSTLVLELYRMLFLNCLPGEAQACIAPTGRPTFAGGRGPARTGKYSAKQG